MAMFHGKNGKVVWNAEDGAGDVDISNVLSWSVNATADVAESTAMNATGDWKTFLGGFRTWTATVECNAEAATPEVPYTAGQSTTANATQGLGGTYDDTDASPEEKVILELWFTSTATDGILWGPAIATGISHTVDANDVAKVTYTFQGNGEILFNAVEPSVFVVPYS